MNEREERKIEKAYKIFLVNLLIEQADEESINKALRRF